MPFQNERHEGKTELAGRTESGDQVPNGIISINSTPLVPVDHDHPIRYLGAMICMNLDSTAQCTAISRTIGYYCHIVSIHRLPVDRAVEFLNTFLVPKIELGLRFACPSRKQTKSWDSLIGKALSSISNASRQLKSEILGVCFGVILPSVLECITKISEAFVRLNSRDSANFQCAKNRWISAQSVAKSARISHAVSLAQRHGIVMEPVAEMTGILSCDDRLPVHGSHYHSKIDNQVMLVIRGPRRPWGMVLPQREVRIWAAASSPTSSVDPKNEQPSGWGICVCTDRLIELSKRGSKDVADKDLLKVLGFGDQIAAFSPGGIYTCRLIALAHALLCVPVSWHINVVMVQGVFDALHWYSLATTDRHLLKFCGRPVLRLLRQIICLREQIGGRTQFIRYEGQSATVLDTIGMNCAKMWASTGRCQRMAFLTPLPPQLEEKFLSISIRGRKVMGNVRKAIAVHLHAELQMAWQASKSQGRFCSDAGRVFLDSVKALVRQGRLSADHLHFAAKCVTDTVHFIMRDDGKTRAYSTVVCTKCEGGYDADVYHLFTCDDKDSIFARTQLVRTVIDIAWTAGCSAVWRSFVKDRPLMDLIRMLFTSITENDRLRTAFGCFSDNELSSAMAVACVTDADRWPMVGLQWRAAMLRYAYAEWKTRYA